MIVSANRVGVGTVGKLTALVVEDLALDDHSVLVRHGKGDRCA